MKIITRAQYIEAQVSDYVKRHAHIRGRGKIFRFPTGVELEKRYNELKAAGPIGDDQANELMGFVPWLECDECEAKDVPKVLHLGDDPEYDMRWWVLCPACVRKAFDLSESTA